MKVDRKTNQRIVTIVQTAEDQSNDEQLENRRRDKVTDAVQLTQHGEAVRDTYVRYVRIIRSQSTEIPKSRTVETGSTEVEPIVRAEVGSRSVEHQSSSVFPGFNCSRLHLIQLPTSFRP